MAPGARSKFGAAMFEFEVVRKLTYCIEESTCAIIGTFRPHRSHSTPPTRSDSAPGELCPPCYAPGAEWRRRMLQSNDAIVAANLQLHLNVDASQTLPCAWRSPHSCIFAVHESSQDEVSTLMASLTHFYEPSGTKHTGLLPLHDQGFS